jgi:hypothetical protein
LVAFGRIFNSVRPIIEKKQTFISLKRLKVFFNSLLSFSTQ